MNAPDRPRVVLVDDESWVVDSLVLSLRKDYQVHTALSGDEALKILKQIGGAAVVVSDMRMPGMDGVTLLQHVMAFYPQTTRILLTGEPGREAAMEAVNKAHVFSVHAKPCPPEQLRAAVEAGVLQHRLVHAERAILKDTLAGCIKALIELLAIANPMAFGRASRVKRLAMEFAAALNCAAFWQLEAAAMLSQIGYVSLPAPLVEKLYYGAPLTPEEKSLSNGMPDVVMTLLEHLPRLDPVIQILQALKWSDEQVARLGDGTIGLGTRILGLALEYDSLITQGHSTDVAIQTLRRRSDRFTAELIEQFGEQLGAGSRDREAREIALKAVQPGMVIMQDLRTAAGTLLVPRGFEVTNLFLERVRQFGPELWDETVKVEVPCVKTAGP